MNEYLFDSVILYEEIIPKIIKEFQKEDRWAQIEPFKSSKDKVITAYNKTSQVSLVIVNCKLHLVYLLFLIVD